MYITQIKNKLTRHEDRMEDLLTGNVFGLWRYLPVSLGLRDVLRSARRSNGEQLQVPVNFELEELEFWPWLQHGDNKGIEPDVLLRLSDSSGQLSIILIEAKFMSGKSSLATPDGQPNDQLAKQMVNLRSIAEHEGADSFALIYLTTDPKFPSESIRNSINELEKKTHKSSESNFYWTNWKAVRSELVKILRSAPENKAERSLLRDAVIILDRLGFSDFTGIKSPFSEMIIPTWTLSTVFNWNVPRAVHYEYRHLKTELTDREI